VITGDLVDRGEPRRIRPFAPSARAVTHAGLRDSRQPRRARPAARAFGADGYLSPDGFIHMRSRIIRCGSSGSTRWFRASITANCAPTGSTGSTAPSPARPIGRPLVMMHHPPFVTGIDYMDKFGLENTAGLAAVIARHPPGRADPVRHLHRPIDRRFAGTVAGTAPEHGASDRSRPRARSAAALHVRAARLPVASVARGQRSRHPHRRPGRLARLLRVPREGLI